jgi:Uma2 family endonuclease
VKNTARLERSFARVVPELVFETKSVDQSERASRAKVRLLLDHGIDVAVFIDPDEQEWEVHRADATEPVILRDCDRFELPDILPGFSVTVGELWPE